MNTHQQHFLHGATEHHAVGDLELGSETYIRTAQLHPTYQHPDYSHVHAQPFVGRRIAAEYEKLPNFDPHAVHAYQAMRDETEHQFRYLTTPKERGGLGVAVETSKEDPYPSGEEMRRDITQNHRLRVLSTAASGHHPFFTDQENDHFRAVHDAFGHAGSGSNFDRNGEEAAWLSHARMYSPLARQAMTTETRGQNSAMIYGHNRGRFPEQKVALLPRGYSDPERTPAAHGVAQVGHVF